MKIIVVGDWLADIYEEAFHNAFKSLGHESYAFGWLKYFNYRLEAQRYRLKRNFILELIAKLQHKLNFGPTINIINKELIKLALNVNPDLIVFYRGLHVKPQTLTTIKKKTQTNLFFYNNDDFLSKHYNAVHKKNIVLNLKYFDHLFVYREKNVNELEKM